jgi:ABC-2 type transport system permease protein
MRTVVTTNINVQQSLQPVAARGWLRGFGNLLRKELGEWWGTRRWWVQLIIWLALLNGITTFMMLEDPAAIGFTPLEQAHDIVRTFLVMGAAVTAIGVITTVQGAIVGEKQLGTAAWVMSKPAARPAFILAKAVAHAIGFALTAAAIPAVVFYIEARLVLSMSLAPAPFLAGVALLVLGQLFYLVLTLLLGTIFSSRGPIAGIGLGVLLGGMVFKGILPSAVVMLMPWLLPEIGSRATLGTPLPPNWLVPIIATGCAIVAMTAVAVWRFAREEF